MKKTEKYSILFSLAPGIVILDQITKWYVRTYVTFGERIPVIESFFDIVHFRNTGAAFGMFAHLSPGIRPLFFYGITTIAAVFLVLYFRSLHDKERAAVYAISCVFGGMVGNLIDRIRFGNVVDFLSVHLADWEMAGIELEWPAFNVADSAITIAMIMLLWLSLKRKA